MQRGVHVLETIMHDLEGFPTYIFFATPIILVMSCTCQQKLDTKYKKFDIKDEPLNKAI